MNKVEDLLNSAIEMYSQNDFLDYIKEAKKEYFELAGKILEDDDDFESRMNGFNYWYLTQWNSERETLINQFVSKEEVDDETKNAISNINHSLFEYKGKSFTGKHTFKDILHDKKLTIANDLFNHSIIKGDLFVARSIEVDGKIFMLNDVSLLPSDVKSILVKESKKVRKLNDKTRDLDFLMEIEKLKTKWRRYGHVDPKKIFVFNL